MLFKIKIIILLLNSSVLREAYTDIFKFDINPFEVIDEIVFDPRMDKVIYERNKEITESWGFDKKIIQSGLYKIKEFKMELNPLQ